MEVRFFLYEAAFFVDVVFPKLSPTSPTSDQKSPLSTNNNNTADPTNSWVNFSRIYFDNLFFATKYQQKQGKCRNKNNNNIVWKAMLFSLYWSEFI